METAIGASVWSAEDGQFGTVLGYMAPKRRGWATFELWTVRLGDGTIVQRTREQLGGPGT